VVLFRPHAGEVVPISREDHAVVGLAASLTGETLVALSGAEGAVGYVSSYARSVGYRMTNLQAVQPAAEPWLCPLVTGDSEGEVGLWDGNALELLRLPQLLPEELWSLLADVHWSDEGPGVVPGAGLLLPADDTDTGKRRLHVFLLCDNYLGYLAAWTGRLQAAWRPLGWRATLPTGSTLLRPPLAWVPASADTVELAAVGPRGMLCWARVENAGRRLDTIRRATMSLAQPCLAATLVRPGLVVAVTARAVYWFRVVGEAFAQTNSVAESFPTAVACFPHHRGNELIIVCGDGTIARLPAPA
jgi:hypothetical protein